MKKGSNTFLFTPDRFLVGTHTTREDESGEHQPQPVLPQRVRQPVHSVNPKGINQSAASLIAPPVILIAIIGRGHVTSRRIPATIAGSLVGSVIAALVVILHRPGAIVFALPVHLLIVVPALLLAIQALRDAYPTLGTGRRRIAVLVGGTASHQENRRNQQTDRQRSRAGFGASR